MEQIAAIILAGGKNSRMNFYNKGLLPYHQTTFLETIYKKFAHFPECFLSVGAQGLPPIDLPNTIIIHDLYTDIGPMGGLYTGLLKTTKEHLFCTPCDSPYITEEFILRMINAVDVSQYDAIVPITSDNGVHPLQSIYSKQCLPYFEEAIKTKHYSIRYVLDHVRVKEVPLESLQISDDVLLNINTPEEYYEYVEHL